MLRSLNNIKQGLATSGSVTLSASADQSFRVKDIQVAPNASDGYLTVKVGMKTVGYFRLIGKSGNHLPILGATAGRTIIGLLNDVFSDAFVFPIAKGEKLILEHSANAADIIILYDEYDGDDVKNTEPNGSHGKVLSYLHYIDYDGAITTAVQLACNTSLNPSEFPNFPIGGVVPDKSTIELLGIAAAGASQGTGSESEGRMQHLRLIHEGLSLADEDFKGWLIRSASHTAGSVLYPNDEALFGPYTGTVRGEPLLFKEPHVFRAGEELNVMIGYVTGTSFDLDVSIQDIALILRLTKV